MEVIMHEQKIAADVDPDLEQAKVDLLPCAAQIRDLTKRLLGFPEESRERKSLQAEIQRQMEFIMARADRLAMSADGLLMLLTAELDNKARRGGPAPSRATSRTLLARREAILIRVTEAQEQQKAWGVKVLQELDALAAADEAIRRHGARGLR
jgi:hypothetical protein